MALIRKDWGDGTTGPLFTCDHCGDGITDPAMANVMINHKDPTYCATVHKLCTDDWDEMMEAQGIFQGTEDLDVWLMQLLHNTRLPPSPTLDAYLKAAQEGIHTMSDRPPVSYKAFRHMRFPIPTRFGPWTFDPHLLTLTHDEYRYEVDLELMTTSAHMLDWIMQVGGKPWERVDTMASLVEALERLLNPQHHLCSFGIEKGPIDPKAIIEGVIRQHGIETQEDK